MSEPYITHNHIAAFAKDSVNLREDHVKDYREQVRNLRERLDKHIAENPDYSLVKMLHSGSVRKGTALKTVNDMDVAVYVRAADAPTEESDLLNWLTERLREAYKNLNRDQINPQTHCVTISFSGSGLDVDVVPVIYEDGADNRGFLITKDTGDRVLTSVSLHLEFIRRRKNDHPFHFAQFVRLVKWWARLKKRTSDSFRFKSFMVELICAHLVREGLDPSDYPAGLEAFFLYVVQTGLKERVYFTDYYKSSELPPRADSGVIEIFDPVNPKNNVAHRYSVAERDEIIEAAHDALDALVEAHHATTQERALDMWKSVLGPSFKV
ncbi:MAG TPA: CBASS oligonucleotide cyclase [Pirellulaceae bacterium]|nr:CBASS oligonucleotide cyclase [Pyrinomonadaceae bacterium]HMP65569.1 CBASS oligonucleotide cyclase [Pyrinomonadaceae bacterium]HMP70725.1 CBASS oligonucleotide cyclase [Pirellulaceae bacterium]